MADNGNKNTHHETTEIRGNESSVDDTHANNHELNDLSYDDTMTDKTYQGPESSNSENEFYGFDPIPSSVEPTVVDREQNVRI